MALSNSFSPRPQTPAKDRSAGTRCSGLTLAEVMMAVMVMTMVISTSITTLEYGYRTIDNARSMTIAGQVLQSLIEDLRMQTWSTVSGLNNLSGNLATFNTSGSSQSTSFTGYSATEAAILNRFTFTRTVTTLSGYTDLSGNANLKVFVFTAQWTGIDGRTHSLRYTTYYAQNGLYAYYST